MQMQILYPFMGFSVAIFLFAAWMKFLKVEEKKNKSYDKTFGTIKLAKSKFLLYTVLESFVMMAIIILSSSGILTLINNYPK